MTTYTAGRDLDALIAEKVMKLQVIRFSGNPLVYATTKSDEDGKYLPCYSTAIADAWTVVEKLGKAFEVHYREGAFSCLIEEGDEVTAHYIAEATAETAPLAICLAALKAVGA